MKHEQIFVVNDKVVHSKKPWKGIITEVNDKFGWFNVRWSDGINRVYSYMDSSNSLSVILDLEFQRVPENRDPRADRRTSGTIGQHKPGPY